MKKTVVVCDKCGNEVDGSGGVMRLSYYDGRRGSKVAELCGTCSEQLAGRPAARRGRRRKEEVQTP